MTDLWSNLAGDGLEEPVAGRAGLEVHHVAKSFGNRVALLDASLSVAPGQIVAVMGPSGSGKSTLLHCAAGVLRPDSGAVRFDGHDLVAATTTERARARRTTFGFVFQFGQLVPELTAVENVALPLLLNGTPRRFARVTAHEMLTRLGVADVADQRPGAMSGGQAQRVAVARALVTGPRVIFADEPTGSLDSVTGRAVMEQFVAGVRQENAAMVLVTHDDEVAEYADRIVTVRDGRTDTPTDA
ncbi:ABC transporter ATP-binding protein [Cellulomonas sp. KRMCY2]|uniref:ABC transporter ATP-binding protein n=1 Tax=Cellulomonas sp. KRMCY2 TaxID=1304865 RepID=UPI00045E7F73|nr:ABC transporter ATP-binding protein [Cellulomonas sp. KRMCY2]